MKVVKGKCDPSRAMQGGAPNGKAGPSQAQGEANGRAPQGETLPLDKNKVIRTKRQAGEAVAELKTIEWVLHTVFYRGEFLFGFIWADFLPTMPPSWLSKREMPRVNCLFLMCFQMPLRKRLQPTVIGMMRARVGIGGERPTSAIRKQ